MIRTDRRGHFRRHRARTSTIFESNSQKSHADDDRGNVGCGITDSGNSHGVLNKSGNYVSAEVAGKMKGKVILPGSTVFAKIGEAVRLNRRAWVASEGLVDNNVMAVKAVDERMDLFVNYFLRTVDLNEVARSTAVPSVRKGDVESLGFLCPPLEEQKAIADKLDELELLSNPVYGKSGGSPV